MKRAPSAPRAVVLACAFFVAWATGCSTSPGESGDGGNASGEQCVTVDAGSSCEGQSITFCSTLSGETSTCTSAYYRVGERTIPCQSCAPVDIESCEAQATMACMAEGGGTGGDAGAD